MARVLISGGGAARHAALDGSLVVVGSDASCHVRIESPDVSPVHCEFRRGPDGWRVVDMESRSGTKVNGEYVNTRALRDGDVVMLAGVTLLFEGDAAGAAAPAAQAAPSAARGVPAGAPALHRGPAPRPGRPGPATAHAAPRTPEEEAAADARKSKRLAKKADSAASGLMIAAGVVGAVVVGWILFGVVFGDSHNGKLRGKIAAAERAHQWQRMIDLAAEAEDDGSYEFQQIRIASDRARQSIANDAAGERVEQSIKDWTALRYWRQEHYKDDEEYVRRIDEFLRAYAGVRSEGTRAAREDRVKVAGTSAVGGDAGTGEEAWLVALTDAAALEKDGRIADAIRVVDAFWQANGSAGPTFLPRVEAEKQRLTDAAGKWFDRQVALAAHYLQNGEKKKAQRTIEEAGRKIGLPGFEKRAAEAVDRLFAPK